MRLGHCDKMQFFALLLSNVNLDILGRVDFLFLYLHRKDIQTSSHCDMSR